MPDASGFGACGRTRPLPSGRWGRVMALNKQVYDDIPHLARLQRKKPPGPHPYKASQPHQYWFIDGRMMDFALDGVRWWSLLVLEGYSRTIVAGAVAPVEASWVALVVLYTAGQRLGAPGAVISGLLGW